MSRPRRLDGFEYRGLHQYFVTFCARGRVAVFRDADIARLVIDHFLRTASAWDFAVLAYCVMPDHVHLLVEGTSVSSDFRRFVKRLKQGAAQAYAHRSHGPLWQEGYFEHVLRAEEDARKIARYVIDNPVRAGLVHSPMDYPYAGSGVWSMRELLYGIA